ncbi:MAG: type II secretion system protein, partial [Candidatus Omnitrophica bacterium]|nr:type II secretion system protein [Candidatus Omnitrophota bacterium]
MNPLKNRVLSPTIRARMRGESGFSMLELLLVMGILMILIGILSISGVEIMEKSRKETALKGIAAMFRHARQGALTTNQPRRIVLEMSYDSQASTPREAYELGPKLEYWVEKKVIRNQGWESGYEQVIGPNEMPPGSTLIDINGNALIPENLTDGRLNKNGTYSYFTVIEFNSKGTIVAAYQEDRGPNGNQIFTPEDQRQVLRPLALHFIFTSPDIDVS